MLLRALHRPITSPSAGRRAGCDCEIYASSAFSARESVADDLTQLRRDLQTGPAAYGAEVVVDEDDPDIKQAAKHLQPPPDRFGGGQVRC